MGCACAKSRVPPEEFDSPKVGGEATSNHSSQRTAVRRSNASAKVETADPAFVIDKDSHNDRPKARPKQNGTQLVELQSGGDAAQGRSRRDRSHAADPHPRSGSVPKSLEGEQVAAGWPSWLSQVAGEAIKGWIPRHAASFEKLDKVSSFSSSANSCIAITLDRH